MFMAARFAAAMHEAVREYSASQIAPKVVLHVAGERSFVRVARVLEEALEVVAHDAVEHRLGGAPGAIRRCECSHGVRKAALVPRVWLWIFRRIVTLGPVRDTLPVVHGQVTSRTRLRVKHVRAVSRASAPIASVRRRLPHWAVCFSG
jgi:hypothetical protein